MEKRTPHYPLFLVKRFIGEERVRLTFSAYAGGAGLGLDRSGILDVVSALTNQDFYKSMTTHEDHRVWQDVYRPSTITRRLYVKLTVLNELLIVSFKEL